MVFWADVPMSNVRGSEQANTVPSGNRRPWIVVSSDKMHSVLPIVIAVPLTSESKPMVSRVVMGEASFVDGPPVPGFDRKKLQVALVEQLRALSHERLGDTVIARLRPNCLGAIEPVLMTVLDLLG